MEEGWEDILNDIESRIAEILNEKRSETKQVITMAETRGKSRLEAHQHLTGIPPSFTKAFPLLFVWPKPSDQSPQKCCKTQTRHAPFPVF